MHRFAAWSPLLALCLSSPAAGGGPDEALFEGLPVLDEIRCGDPADAHPFSEEPKGASKIETVLGVPCRTLPNAGGPKYFAYRIGAGKGLKAGAPYVLSVRFPEDQPRGFFILNRGCEAGRGVQSGAALGDTLYGFTHNNNESLQVPLSGAFVTWRMVFWLHDHLPGIRVHRDKTPRPHRPEDGFWIVIAQSKEQDDPLSKGAAAATIRLHSVPDPTKLELKVNFPPEGLPRRRLFWREEMSDEVVQSRKPEERGVANESDWYEYKARLMKVLGMNTFAKDLLEFGHNQGWDTAPFCPNDDWVNRSAHPQRWEEILRIAARHGLDVLPYYEYSGSIGQKSLGIQKRCIRLGGGSNYTNISWCEKANADVTDPETLEDAKKVLDATITRFKGQASFAGAWFRPRPASMPVSFSDRCLGLFAKESNGGAAVTRPRLQGDKTLLEKYYGWWFGKRRDFLAALRDHLRAKVDPKAAILFTADPSEPGRPLIGSKSVVTDDPETWKKIFPLPGHHQWSSAPLYDAVVKETLHLKALLTPLEPWDQWESQHASPRPDPENYARTEGVMMTYTFNRAYTVSSPAGFDAFRTAGGLAIARHYALNEEVLGDITGYFCCDVDRTGPYSMLPEARAVAYGDPTHIAYLSSTSFNRAFPEHARAFNAAFLALPALPGERLPTACDHPDVVVRAIRTPAQGTYVAVVNVGLREAKDVAIRLPGGGPATDAAAGKPIAAPGGVWKATLRPCELRALHVGR